MIKNKLDELHRINYLVTETEALYHQASLKLGITDSVSIVLYSIYVSEELCLLSNIYKQSGISKQTVNSAIRNLETKGILYLEQYSGKTKKIVLTTKGNDYINQTVAKLYEAEIQAFESWSTQEINTYINLMEKYSNCFRKQIDAL